MRTRPSFGLLKRRFVQPRFVQLACQRGALRGLSHVRDRSQAPRHHILSSFGDASGAHDAKQYNHKCTADEEQELSEAAPTSMLPGLSPESLAADPQHAAEALAEEGVLRLNGVLCADVCTALRVHIDGILMRSMQSVASGSVTYSSLFGEYMCREHRYHLLLPMDEHILEVCRHVIHRVAPLLEHSIGEDCTMCELEALVNDPGSHAQPLHFDTEFDENEPRVTMLIALQDVTSSMGATAFYPGTNTPDWHIAYKQRGQELEELLEFHPRVVGEMDAGDCFLYDARVLHYGGANTSHLPIFAKKRMAFACRDGLNTLAPEDMGTRRTMLALSFQVESGHFRVDNTNMRSNYRSKYRISDAGMWTSAC